MIASRCIFVSLAAVQGVRAWGVLGHATVAYIAQNYVSDSTASWAQDILGDTSSSYLASVASWADDYRSTPAGKFSAPYHYIDAEDNPPSSCSVDFDRDCSTSGCSVSAIANYTQRVTDGRLTATNTAIALKFLVHLLGDITQPLHDEAYKVGGNDIDVKFDGYDDNLHSDWDTYIPEKLVGGGALTDAQRWASDLVAEIESGAYKAQAAGWIASDNIKDAKNTAIKWAADANALVCSVVMPDGEAALHQGDLYPGYYNSVVPTVEVQIAKGGYRLANWLNLLAESDTKRKREEKMGVVSRRALPDLMGRDLLPAERPLSRAKMARREAGFNCNHAH